jgi:hypothetical protein
MTSCHILQSALACVCAALPLSSTATTTTSPPGSSLDIDQQMLEESLHALDSLLNKRKDDASRHDGEEPAAMELAVACRGACTRLLALATARTAKRINTSHGTWKSAKSVHGNLRQGLEIRRLEERLREVWRGLTVEVGKMLRYVNITQA